MNTIYIQTPEAGVIKSSILDDFQIEAVSEFGSIAELVPTLDTLVGLGTALQSTGTNTTSRTAVMARSILDAPRWLKTNPVKITVDLHFYTQDNAKKNVIDNINSLLALHILRFSSEGKLMVPGLNANNLRDMSSLLKKDTPAKKKPSPPLDVNIQLETQFEQIKKSKQDNTISVLIPGVVYLPLAFIYAIQPTYSKFMTDGGYPLWATANVQIVSFSPAMVDNFEDGMNMIELDEMFYNIATKTASKNLGALIR